MSFFITNRRDLHPQACERIDFPLLPLPCCRNNREMEKYLKNSLDKIDVHQIKGHTLMYTKEILTVLSGQKLNKRDKFRYVVVQ